MIDDATKEWFAHKVNANSEFIVLKYLPALEQVYNREHRALHEACRSGDLSAIKLQQGRLDGVHEVLGIISGMRMSESGNPDESGLLSRIPGIRRLVGRVPAADGSNQRLP